MEKVVLKTLKKLYAKINSEAAVFRNWKMFSHKEYANDLLYKKLIADQPCMIARFGSTEMMNLANYIGVKNKGKLKSYKNYVFGKTPAWWWERSNIMQLYNWSGFFPPTTQKVEQFCELMIADVRQIDILGAWLLDEKYFDSELKQAKRLLLEDLEPFFVKNPWTRALKGRKVLVVHPFVETIQSQYKKRKLLFEEDVLPEFELKTVKAVQGLAGADTGFSDWFEALEFMKSEIDKIDYDICIIGAGAYGLPLAAHVKRKGKKAVHLAGATQLLFGIIGNRWEHYIVWPYMNLFNEHWVRPGNNETPKRADSVEGACYW